MQNILSNKETNDSIFNMLEDYFRFYSSFYKLGFIRKVDYYFHSGIEVKCLVIHSNDPNNFDADIKTPIDIPLIALLSFVYSNTQTADCGKKINVR